MSVKKISDVEWSDIAKVDDVVVADISKIDGIEKPAGVVYFLDTYPNPSAAYSLRKLSSSATTAITVENSARSTADIGFDANGDLDTAALTAHCGSNYGRVSKWWDQSGNGNHMEQTSSGSRPYIVDASGNVITTTTNSIPALDFYFGSTARWLEDTFVSNNGDEFLISYVSEFRVVNTAQQIVSQWASSQSSQVLQMTILGATSKLRSSARYTNNSLGRSDSNSAVTTDTEYVVTNYMSASPYEGDLDINGDTADTDTGFPTSGSIRNNSQKMALGRRSDNGNAQYRGYTAELIIWSSTMPNRTNVMTDTKTHYGIS